MWCWFLSWCWANNWRSGKRPVVDRSDYNMLLPALHAATAPCLCRPNRRMRWGVSFETFRVCQQYRTAREKPAASSAHFPPNQIRPSRLNWADLSSSSVPAMIFFCFIEETTGELRRPLYQQGLSILSILLSILAFLHHVRLLLLRLCICWPVSAPSKRQFYITRALLCVYTGK